MKVLTLCSAIAVLIGCSISLPLDRVKRWQVQHLDHVVAPGIGPLPVDDAHRRLIAETLSDSVMGLTVIKDPSDGIKACFITDYDPNWSLTKLDKMEIVDTKTYDIVNSPMAWTSLQQKAGPIISSLCKKFHIYWLNQKLPMPLPKNPTGTSGSGVKTPPFNPVVKTPPPLNLAEKSHTEHVMKVPPPLNLAKQSETEHVAAPAHIMRVPPPLNLAEQSEPEHVTAPDQMMKVPPPLNLGQETKEETPMKVPPPLVQKPRMNAPPPLSPVKIPVKSPMAVPFAVSELKSSQMF